MHPGVRPSRNRYRTPTGSHAGDKEAKTREQGDTEGRSDEGKQAAAPTGPVHEDRLIGAMPYHDATPYRRDSAEGISAVRSNLSALSTVTDRACPETALHGVAVNANRDHFQAGVRDLAVTQTQHPGWLSRLLTHPVRGLDRFFEALANPGQPGVIKTYLEISS